MFELSFNTDSVAFDGTNKAKEVAKILRGITYNIQCGRTEDHVSNSSGLLIGEWRLTPE